MLSITERTSTGTSPRDAFGFRERNRQHWAFTTENIDHLKLLFDHD